MTVQVPSVGRKVRQKMVEEKIPQEIPEETHNEETPLQREEGAALQQSSEGLVAEEALTTLPQEKEKTALPKVPGQGMIAPEPSVPLSEEVKKEESSVPEQQSQGYATEGVPIEIPEEVHKEIPPHAEPSSQSMSAKEQPSLSSEQMEPKPSLEPEVEETPSQENVSSVVEEPSEQEEALPADIAQVDFNLLDTEGRWLLKVLSGPNIGAEFALHGGSSYLIGTDTQACDVVFQDLSVSRKHANLTIDSKENAVLEDLKSRNGTFVDGERIEKKTLSSNVLVSMGTTTFILIDREADQTTIVAAAVSPEKKEEVIPEKPPEVSPKEEKPRTLGPIQEAVLAPMQSEVDRVKEEQQRQAKLSQAISSLVILAIVIGLIMLIGIGGALLFRTETVSVTKVADPDEAISAALSAFPAIRYSYNPTRRRLLLVGHVLTSADRTKMLDKLQQLTFIDTIDYNNVVIDELVWREINQVIAKHRAWRGISITSPVAGRYILTGFLRTRAQAEELFDCIAQNFAYLDLLERKVVIEEDLLAQVNRELRESGFPGVSPALNEGELILTGIIGMGSKDRFQKLVTLFRALPGIRSVQVLVSEAGQREAVVDLSSKYHVTGYSRAGRKVSVVIEGKILGAGDTLDDMFITDISPTTIYLEKDGLKYKIDFNL